MTVVSNASPLITLAKVGALHVLPALFDKVVVATEVFHEIAVIGAERPGASDVQGALWIEVKSCSNAAQFTQRRSQYGLGAGEIATILVAQELSANLAIIDERRARSLATNLGINVMGCVAFCNPLRARTSSPICAAFISSCLRVEPTLIVQSSTAVWNHFSYRRCRDSFWRT